VTWAPAGPPWRWIDQRTGRRLPRRGHDQPGHQDRRALIEIDRRTSAFTYLDGAGRLLTREPARGGKTLEPIDVPVSVFDETTTIDSRANADGVRFDALDVRRVVDRRAFHTKLEFEWADGEALYGLGSHEEGMFNLRGQHQYLYQQNLKAAVPVLVSSRGYGVFVDCTSMMTFHDDAFGSCLWSDVDEELDYYFIVGPELDDIVAQLRELTGRAPMPPKWAFGYIQSKERYASQAELLDVARRYRELRLPLDCVVLDWKSWPGDLWGQKSLDPGRFPDPCGMTEELHALGVRLMVSIWPILQPGGDDWRELSDAGHLLGNRATYDAFDRDARALYWSQADRGLFSRGVDAWWSDCTEPFEADWLGPVKPEPEERQRINTAEAKRYLDPEVVTRSRCPFRGHLHRAAHDDVAEARAQPDPVRLYRPAALWDRDLVGRRLGDVGDVAPTDRGGAQLLRHRHAVLDHRRRSILRRPTSRAVVLGGRLRRWSAGPWLSRAVRALVPVRGLAAHVPGARHRHASRGLAFRRAGRIDV
jgi:alpha-D-xyloside xylohydrolase